VFAYAFGSGPKPTLQYHNLSDATHSLPPPESPRPVRPSLPVLPKQTRDREISRSLSFYLRDCCLAAVSPWVPNLALQRRVRRQCLYLRVSGPPTLAPTAPGDPRSPPYFRPHAAPSHEGCVQRHEIAFGTLPPPSSASVFDCEWDAPRYISFYIAMELSSNSTEDHLQKRTESMRVGLVAFFARALCNFIM
jgi:hypothetical protein